MKSPRRTLVRSLGWNFPVLLGLLAVLGQPGCGTTPGPAPGSGGTASGGVGPTTGGTTGSGGIGSGGVASGGTSSGGSVATGGQGTGGASSGGAASGGAASGGAGTGGAGTGGNGSGGGSSDGPCPTDGPCRILPLGDSITEGLIGGVNTFDGGYRVGLFDRAVTDGHDITFVGTRMNGPDMVAGQPFPKGHEGESGIKIQALANKTVLFNGDPNIVLLHIGTNDIFQNDNLAGMPDRLEAFVDDILAHLEETPDKPQGLLVVAKLIPMPGNVSQLATYNAAIEALVDEKAQAGAPIILCDQFTGYPDGHMPDSIHPDPEGYDWMGGTWYDVIGSYLP